MKSKYHIIESENTESHLNSYCDFISELYAGDTRKELYCNENKKLLSKDNPFFKHCKIKHFAAIDSNNTMVGHVSAMLDSRLDKIGIIGFYDCIEDIDVSNELLSCAVTFFRQNKCAILKGPINLSIWHSYRFVVSFKRQLNLFDPFNKKYYIDYWKRFGFTIAEKYVSAVRSDFNYILGPTKADYNTNIEKGFKIRQLDQKQIKSELRIIYNLCQQIFKTSWNFSPISFEEFNYIYDGILDKIDPSYVELVEGQDCSPVGFCFTFPNPLVPKQIVLKTIGVLHEFQRNKLGAMLLYSAHARAKEKGFHEFYYPLIRIGNSVTKLPYEGYDIITTYVSFEKLID